MEHLGVEGASVISLGVAQVCQHHRLLSLDLGVSAVLDKDRLAAPLDSDRVSLLDGIQLDFQGCHCQHIVGRLQANRLLNDALRGEKWCSEEQRLGLNPCR